MGWGSGSELMESIVSSIENYVDEFDVRKKLYIDIISIFENHDWDTQDECIGSSEAFDAALAETHPNWEIWKEI